MNIATFAKSMITYVLSQHPTAWHVTRYGQEDAQPVLQTTTEEDALAAIVARAQDERPSQIVRISISGESRIIATFEEP